ncbi:UDP-glucuronic acid decarboxylase 1 [Tanacetum coccineum]
MKQLHKQSILNQRRDEESSLSSPTSQNQTYSPKSTKHQTSPRSIFTRSIHYILKEQRLLFIIIGILIGSALITLKPTSSFNINKNEAPLLMPRSNKATPFDFGGFNKPVSGRIPVSIGGKRRRVVVTGGSGFVGSHLVDKLMARGDDVIVIDNFFTGRKENVKHHFGNPRFELIRHDVVEPILLEVDQIYHLACPASPVHYKYNPVKTIISFCFILLLFVTNVMGTLNMLGLAKRIGARFLLTSTSEVYGDPLEHPQKETYWGHVNPIGVRSCYDEGKRTAETLTMDYHRGDGVEVIHYSLVALSVFCVNVGTTLVKSLILEKLRYSYDFQLLLQVLVARLTCHLQIMCGIAWSTDSTPKTGLISCGKSLAVWEL